MYRCKYNSPLGLIYLESDGTYLTGLWFDNSKHSDIFEEKNLEIFDETKKWLDTYFRGEVPSFIPKYKVKETLFQKSVRNIMEKIPYGEVILYGDIAKIIAKERNISRMSSKAVGNAVGTNPICIIIPCHRVVGKDGNLTGYSGGLDKKIKLLEIEKLDMSRFFISKKRGQNEKM